MSKSGRQKYNFNNSINFNSTGSRSINFDGIGYIKSGGTNCFYVSNSSGITVAGARVNFNNGDFNVRLKRTLDNLVLTTDGVHYGAVCRIKTGQYTGDGSTSQAITGVGFKPKCVKIIAFSSSDAMLKTFFKDDNNSGEYCTEISEASRVEDGHILSLDTDGFTVSDNSGNEEPNKNLQVYNYICWS